MWVTVFCILEKANRMTPNGCHLQRSDNIVHQSFRFLCELSCREGGGGGGAGRSVGYTRRQRDRSIEQRATASASVNAWKQLQLICIGVGEPLAGLGDLKED